MLRVKDVLKSKKMKQQELGRRWKGLTLFLREFLTMDTSGTSISCNRIFSTEFIYKTYGGSLR
jgi:hypothetical protein